MTDRQVIRSARCSGCGAEEIDAIDCGATMQLERLSCGLLDLHVAMPGGWLQIHLQSDAQISIVVVERSDEADPCELDRDSPCRCGEDEPW